VKILESNGRSEFQSSSSVELDHFSFRFDKSTIDYFFSFAPDRNGQCGIDRSGLCGSVEGGNRLCI
jgi:Golgi nucleoside diphosphatase